MFFDEVYSKHYQELRRFGHQLNIPSEKCEDLTQETFLKFYLELKKEVVFENPRAWLYKVYLNLFRTARVHDSLTENSGEPELSGGLSHDLQEEYAREEKKRMVFGLLERLEERDREILILYNRGLSYKEIAGILGMNPNSVGKTLVRAIESLKKNIKIYCNELFEQS